MGVSGAPGVPRLLGTPGDVLGGLSGAICTLQPACSLGFNERLADYLPLVTCYSGFWFAASLIREPLLGVYPHAGAHLSTLCNAMTMGIKNCSVTKVGWVDS